MSLRWLAGPAQGNCFSARFTKRGISPHGQVCRFQVAPSTDTLMANLSRFAGFWVGWDARMTSAPDPAALCILTSTQHFMSAC